MNEYRKSINSILISVTIGLLLIFILFITNQIIQITSFAHNIHPLLGKSVLLLTIIIFGCIILIPIISFIMLPGSLIPPNESDVKAYNKYIEKLKYRLAKNHYLKDSNFIIDVKSASKRDIQTAIDILDQRSTEIIKTNASKVFLTTAISQNGALDGIFVLITLSNMIWKISHLYNQRPNLKDIWILYVNVGATVLMAREIDDLNLLDEQLEPVITYLLGGTLANLVPGTKMMTNLIVNSIIEGAANAFLTLRVGAIAKKYCSTIKPINRKKLRYSATLEACSMMGDIIQENSVAISKAFAGATKKTVSDTIKNTKSKTKQFIGDKAKNLFGKEKKAT